MALISHQRVTLAGAAITYGAASGGGDTVNASPNVALHYKNASGAPITVTIVTPGSDQYGSAVPDLTVSVPAAGERFIGPLVQSLNDLTDGVVKITYSGVTSLTVAAVQI